MLSYVTLQDNELMVNRPKGTNAYKKVIHASLYLVSVVKTT